MCRSPLHGEAYGIKSDFGATKFSVMCASFFETLDESDDGGRYLGNPATAGPWSPAHQHGGPPNALLVQVVERVTQARTNRHDLVALRLAAEFVGPVLVGPVEVRAEIVRSARSAVLVSATLASGGRDCLHGRIWLLAQADTSAVAPDEAASSVPDGLGGIDIGFPYGHAIEWRMVSGNVGRPGPGVTWARPRLAVLDGAPVSGLGRAALIGDSASGLSSALDWAHWSFLNVDLDVHLARPVRGEWILMDAVTQLGPSGSALASSTLSDVAGRVGATMQTLSLAPSRR
jgi:hypothetical protein